MNRFLRWAPVLVLGSGVLLSAHIREQSSVPLRVSLEQAIPAALLSHSARNLEISEAEQRVAGMDDYLYRAYLPVSGAPGGPGFTLYVGYYRSQAQGRTIHSPRNCLPGGGWEALTSSRQDVRLADGRTVTVNRYLIHRGSEQAVVLYWYQGRGRVQDNEFAVKWDLLRDAALTGRTEEALVRLIVPVQGEHDALEVALRAARQIIPAMDRALPT